MNYHTRPIAVIALMIVVTLACSIQGSPTATQDPGLVQTQVSMAMTQTAMRSQSQIDLPEPTQDNGLVSTQVALAMTQTALANPPALPTNTIAFPTAKPTQEPTATQQDIKSLIDNSNILVYEDMIDYPEYITVVNKALKSVGGHHKYVGDAIGTLMTQLNSGTDWDLIIIAAEGRGAISGDYWDVIKNQVDDGVGLIAELWYLDDIGAGKIAPLLYECGVEVEKDWWRVYGDDPLKFDIYWSEPHSPVFNEPNRVASFPNSLFEPAWSGDIGDLMRLTSGSDATILASHTPGEGQSSYGLITSCMEGRMILQTFDTHDYPTDPMVALWQNYIRYTLTNHFNQ